MAEEQVGRTNGLAVEPRSVRGTIRLPESDPDLKDGKKFIRELFDRSMDQTARALAEGE